MNNQEITNFYETLFDKEDWVCFGENIYKTQSYPVSRGHRANDEFFVINALEENSTRSIKNITKFRNFLFEIDEDMNGNKVPSDIQGAIIKQSGIPYSTAVFSGNKSVHWILSLKEPVADRIEYKAIWKTIESILNKTANELGYNLKFDAQVKDPSRFSRCAGSVRMSTQKLQKIGSNKGRYSIETVEDWMASRDENWGDRMPNTNFTGVREYNPKATDQEKIDHVLKHLMKNQEYRQGNKNGYQFTLARLLRATGMLQNDINSFFRSHFDIIDERDPIGSAFSSNYDSDDQIYVWSLEEKREWARQQDQEQRQQYNNLLSEIIEAAPENIIENGEVADLNANGLDDYIRVGTKVYRADGYSVEIWDKNTLGDDFGRRAIQDVRKYRGFTNEPSYLKYIEYLTIIDHKGDPQSLYNRFFYPNWKLPADDKEFPTIMKLLNKVFVGNDNDQLQIGLDWIQLMLTQPKQRTRALILAGPAETGKDTFMEFLIRIVTDANGCLLEGSEIESNFNTNWIGKHLVCLNEVSYESSDKKTKERLKNLLTAEKITVEGKGENRYQISNHTKIVMATNNMFDFMQIDQTENRYWVREMPPLDKASIDPNFKNKLKAEVPYFIKWITQERELARKVRATRFWHSNEECYTDAAQRVKETSKTNLFDELRTLIEDKFKNPELTDEDSMFVRVKTLTQSLNAPKSLMEGTKTYNQKAVKMCLLKEFGVRDFKNVRADAFENFIESNNLFFEIFRDQL